MGCIIPNMGIKKPRSRTPSRPTSVADALFTHVQQRVLGVLFGNPGRTFYANEIIALANSGTGAVQRELQLLESAELVTSRHIGNQKHYQANGTAPVFTELRGLVLKTSGLADVLRATLVSTAENIQAAFVFGSVARNDDTATSDIDLMVVSDSLTYGDVFAALEDATTALGRKINPTVYSRHELARRIREKNAFVKRVLALPKIWIVGSQHDLAARKPVRSREIASQ